MILDRFWSKVEADGPYGCWEWTASKRTGGYGQLKRQVSRIRAGKSWVHI